jgi:hypothetical protein
MFNNTNNNYKTNINTPATGIIQKSNEKSFFLNFHQNSQLAKKLFEPNPQYQNKNIVIVQMMLINEGYILAECVNLNDGI